MSTKQLLPLEKVVAGLLLILCTVAAIVSLIAFWPDRLPAPGAKQQLYKFELFQMTLLDKICPDMKDVVIPKDTSTIDSAKEETPALKNKPPQQPPIVKKQAKKPALIHLNTLLMILVTSAGFMGAIIHISSSFTAFTGAGQFKRSWLLWYFVKPFTGAGLALALYFVSCASLLNMNDGGSGINIYGFVSLAALAGLFTDKATLKLEEVFTAFFNPKDDRPDKLQDFQIQEVSPTSLEKDKQNTITIKGTFLKKKKVIIKMDGETITTTPTITDNTITFTYTVPVEKIGQSTIKIAVSDEQGKEYFSHDLNIK